MKFFALLSLISMQAWSMDVDQYCSRFPFNEEKIRCYRTVLNKHIDERALDVCMQFSFESERFECLQWILDRIYAANDIKTCHNSVFDSDRKQCLQTRGKPYVKPEDSQRALMIRNNAKMARESLQQGQVDKVDDLLREIIQLTK